MPLLNARLHQRAKEILADSLAKPESERRSFVAEACGSELSLRDEVMSLLDYADRDADLFGEAALQNARDRLAGVLGSAGNNLDEPGELQRVSIETPVRVGAYRILRLVGSGGMGHVYEALQQNPRRRVALKLLRGFDLRPELRRRFEYEAQTLGRLEHPSIARIYEAGIAEVFLRESPDVVVGGSQPFIAMEFVEGYSLAEFLRLQELTRVQQLQLFVQICHAVHHANLKGIVHRDLKPGNILVSDDGAPKVVDFGIARVMTEDGPGDRTETRAGQLVGTPAYMSPEQIVSAADIDIRTDVYALGVILYELLCGVTPVDPEKLRDASAGELEWLIREVEPVAPSTRIWSGQGGPRPTRRGDRLSRELDWIVLKAISKEPARRYQSAADLAADVQRFLQNESVMAAPPSTAYRLRKFVLRHRVSVAAGAAVAAAMVIGAAGLTAGAVWAWQEQARATKLAQLAQQEARRATDAELAERQRADELQRVSDFQAAMLGEVDAAEAGKLLSNDVLERFERSLARSALTPPERTELAQKFAGHWTQVNATDAARELIADTILRPAAEAIDREFADQPLLRARLRHVLAEGYDRLGLTDESLAMESGVLETLRSKLGDDHPRTITSINDVGFVLHSQGKHVDADRYYTEALERAHRVLGGEHPQTIRIISNIGLLHQEQGHFAEAEPYQREALEKRRHAFGENHPDTVASKSNLAILLRSQGKLTEAEMYFREAVGGANEALGEDHPVALQYMNNLACTLQDLGRLGEAAEYAATVLKGRRKVLGEDHPETLVAVNNMARLLQLQNKLVEAEPYYREALDKQRRLAGEEHPNTLVMINNLGGFLRGAGRLDEAQPFSEEALEKTQRLLGAKHPLTLIAISNLGALRTDQGRWPDAEALLLPAAEMAQASLPPRHQATLSLAKNLARLFEARAVSEPDAGHAEKAAYWRRISRGDDPETDGSK